MLINPEMPQRSARKRDKENTLKIVGIVVLILAILGGGVWFWKTKNSEVKGGEETVAEVRCEDGQVLVGEECQEKRPEFLDFSEVVKNWGEKATGLTSAYVYDLDNDQVAGEFYAESNYETESLYKLFVVYEGYRRVSAGIWADEPEYLVTATGTRSRMDCLDLAIRESDSNCAEKIWAEIGKVELDEIVKNEFGMVSTTVSTLMSNPTDIGKMMARYYKHEGISDELVERMKDSFLNQPATNKPELCDGMCDWRQGLPAGFSEKVKAYNKVGWEGAEREWKVYNDAAIVEIPDKKSGATRHYVVVAMTKEAAPTVNRELAKAIEEAVGAAGIGAEMEGEVKGEATEIVPEVVTEATPEVAPEPVPTVEAEDEINPESYVGEPTSE